MAMSWRRRQLSDMFSIFVLVSLIILSRLLFVFLGLLLSPPLLWLPLLLALLQSARRKVAVGRTGWLAG